MNTLPRVLLVEDDASLRRFVELALDELPIELLSCPDVDAALALLASQPVALVITDRMRPGRSGFDLLATLEAAPALRAGARVVVFSAGLSQEVRQRLDRGGGVWRLLSKPCSVAELEGCVREAMALDAGNAAAPVQAQGHEQALEQAVEQAIALQFGGNRALYAAFRASCLQQFAADISDGDRACAEHDGPALHRLAHSLKSVLQTLGHADAAALARRLEDLAAQGHWEQALPLWPGLREALSRLA
jgi:DNA-binding response OmpR family regulator